MADDSQNDKRRGRKADETAPEHPLAPAVDDVRGQVIAMVEALRAEVAAHETLDEARRNYAISLLDRLLTDLRG